MTQMCASLKCAMWESGHVEPEFKYVFIDI
jgi:hypothetical protein